MNAPSVPVLTSWSCLREGINVFFRRLPLLMGAWLVILGIQQLIDVLIPDAFVVAELGAAVVLLVPLYAGQYLLALKAVRNEPTSFRDLFRGFSRWGTLVAVEILIGLVSVLGLCLLIIPGIVWALSFAFATIIVLDSQDRPGVFAAIQHSSELAKGYRGVLFGVSVILALPTIIIATLTSATMVLPSFPLPQWSIELLALLSGTLFLGPISATSYMVAYDAATRSGPPRLHPEPG